MSYKITIIDNENGEVFLNEENAKAIIGAIASEEGVHCVSHVKCNGLELLAALEGTDRAKDTLLKKHPELQMPYALKALMNIGKSESDE